MYQDEYFEQDPWDYEEWIASTHPVSGGYLSIYSLPPIAAILISFILLFSLVGLVKNENLEAAIVTESSSSKNSKPSSKIAPLFTAEIHHWDTQIFEWADKWDLDPNLVATVMQIESCGDPQARSHAGAMGLFQVMPFHFKSQENPYDPDTNAKRGMAYLVQSLDNLQGDVRMGLAGYNAGITGAKRGEKSWPAETVRYTYWGTGIYNDAKAGKSESAVLGEWLSKGGQSLCNQASQRLGINP